MAVETIDDPGRIEWVYNLRVSDFHTYFIGCEEWGFSVWAHNACVQPVHPGEAEYALGHRWKVVGGTETKYFTEKAAAQAEAIVASEAQGAIKANSKEFLLADRTGFEDMPTYRKLRDNIKTNGLNDPLIEYVEIDGTKYILRGNQRVEIAEGLGIQDQLRFKKVELPFLGYRNKADVLDEAMNIIYNIARGKK